ncbi:MAG: hypothetical protein WC288_01385 [Candidatus Paceibacterota bacterium]|jgi:hypothetical protein|nr:hypothetical protein [Candidatus Paceibacterota bacterium]
MKKFQFFVFLCVFLLVPFSFSYAQYNSNEGPESGNVSGGIPSSYVVEINLDTQGNQLPGNQPTGTLVESSGLSPAAYPGSSQLVVNIYEVPESESKPKPNKPKPKTEPEPEPSGGGGGCGGGTSQGTTPPTAGTTPPTAGTTPPTAGTTPPSSSGWSCSVNQKQCHQTSHGAFTSYSSCMAYCNPSSTPTSGGGGGGGGTPTAPPPSTRYACNQENGTCYSNPNGPYSSIASCENSCFRKPCTIDIFSINDEDTSPIRVWVTQLNQGHWSASDYCDNCNISCSPYPDCLWQKDNIGTGGPGAIYQFKLKEYGSYTYTLTCFNSFGDRPSETLQVNAVNLPWWREIIPVLPGSLWGAVKR